MMLSRRLLRSLPLLLLLAPSARALEPGQKLSVELLLSTTRRANGTWGPTEPTGSAGPTLAEGETDGARVSLGKLDPATLARTDLAVRSVASGGPAPGEAERAAELAVASDTWLARIKALPSPLGSVAFEVAWEHWTRADTGVAHRVGGDERRIVMREGERHVLDSLALDASPQDYCICRAEIAVSARIVEDPSFASRSLGYDVWFEHVDARGLATRRHLVATGAQGENVTLDFPPIRLPIAGATMDDGRPIEAIVGLKGSVRGRFEADGSIGLQLQAHRLIDAAAAGSPQAGGIGDNGEKVFTVQPGETVRLALPQASGRYGISRRATGGFSAGYVSQGASAPSGRTGDGTSLPDVLELDNATFFAGSQDSLLLTVRPAP